VADDEGPTGDGSGAADGEPDPFEGLTLDESWVQAARRTEDDAETRVAKLSRIDADYRRLGSDRQTMASGADAAQRRHRNRRRAIVALVIVVLAGLGVASYLRQRSTRTVSAAPVTTTSTTTTAAPTPTTPEGPPSTLAPERLVNGRLPNGLLPMFDCFQDYAPTPTGYEITDVSCTGVFQTQSTWTRSEQVGDPSDQQNRDAECLTYALLDMGMIDSTNDVPSEDQARRMLDAIASESLTSEGYYAPPAGDVHGSLICVIGFNDLRPTTRADLAAAVDRARASLGLPPLAEPSAPSTTTATLATASFARRP